MRKLGYLLLFISVVGFYSCADDATQLPEPMQATSTSNGGGGGGEDDDDPIPPGGGGVVNSSNKNNN